MSSLPDGWTLARLDVLLEDGLFVDGDWVESKDQDSAGEVRLTQLADVGDGNWRNRSDRYMTTEKAEELRCTFLERGDVLVARMPEPLGRACMFPGDPRPCVTVVDVAVLRPRAESVTSAWLMHALNSPPARSAISALQAGSTRKRISRKNLGTVELPVPPLSDQQRIVAELERRLSHLDGAGATLGGCVAKLSTTRAAIGQDLFWRGDHPVKRLGELVTEKLANGRSVRTREGGFPVLRLTCLKAGRVDVSEAKPGAWNRAEAEKFIVREGDFLISRGNGSIRLVGRGGLVGADPGEVASPDTLIRARVDNDVLRPGYLAAVWASGGVRSQIERAARTTAGIYKVNQSDLGSIELPVPPIDVQDALVDEHDRRMSLVGAAESSVMASIRTVGVTRRALLADAVSGRLLSKTARGVAAKELLRVAKEPQQ